MQATRVVTLVLLLPGVGAQEFYKNKIDCIANTGETCDLDLGDALEGKKGSCPAWQGSEAKCHDRSSYCVCTEGTCSSENGVCYRKPYTLLGDGTQYMLKNARWPSYYLYATKPGLVPEAVPLTEATELNAKDLDAFKWTLSWPGMSFNAGLLRSDGASLFLLTSVAYPDSTISGEGKIQPVQLVEHVSGPAGVGPPVWDVGVHLLIAPVEGASAADEMLPIMITSDGWTLAANPLVRALTFEKGDVGAGGYWFFEPPLSQEIRDYLTPFVGTKCSVFCGTMQGVASGARGLDGGSFAMLALLAFALGSAGGGRTL